MKLLSLLLMLNMVGCASDAKQKTAAEPVADSAKEAVKKEAATTQSMAKTEAKKAVKKVVKSSGKGTTCSYGENKRVLEKSALEGGGCEVLYTKDGETSSIATAKNDLSYCDQIIERVIGKLTDAGFKCE